VGKMLLFPLVHILVSSLNSCWTESLPIPTRVSFKRAETGFNSGNLGPSGVCDRAAVSFSQGRNRWRGPRYFNTDLTIMKNTKIPAWENAMLGIGFQFFNLFNHPNFGLPDSNIASQTLGQIFYLDGAPTTI